MATEPAYMNSITSHSKLKTHITLSSPLFVAGQDITGKVELECKAEREVGIGPIIIELLAMQELNSRDHTAATTFIHSHRVFQGPGLPPSNAVYDHTTSQDPFFPHDYFPSRKGVTTFFFKFPTPVSSPSSVSFASDLAKIEYKIRTIVGAAYKGDIRSLTNTIDVELVQCQDMEGTVDEHVVVGDGGKMYVRGKLIGGKVVPGEKACLELHVKNQTSKKTTGLMLALTRSLYLHGARASIPVQLTDTLLSESFRGAEYCVLPNTEGIANLVFSAPSSTRVVKGGIREGNIDKDGCRKRTEPLFELRCYLSVKIGMGFGSKDILLEMPIQIQHRVALGEDAAHDHRNPYLSPVSPEPTFNRTISPLPSHSPRALSPISNPHMSPVLYANQTPAPMYAPYEHFSPKPNVHPRVLNPGDPINARAVSPRLWSPVSLEPITSYPSQSPFPGVYYYPPPLAQPVPFAFPARPNSADPYYYPYYYQNHQTNSPSGLPPASTFNPYPFSYPYHPFHFPSQPQSRLPLPPVPSQQQSPPFIQPPTHAEAPVSTETQTASQPNKPSTSSQLQGSPQILDDQPAEGKGERASRIAYHLHTANRARSASPTSHRFQAPSVSTIRQPPPFIPQRPYATGSRHLLVLSPRPIISPNRTYVGHSSRGVGNGTTKSDRVDLLEQLVDVAPGDEEKSVEEVLRDIEQAERADQDKKKDGPTISRFDFPTPASKAHTRKNTTLLDVFGPGREDHNYVLQRNEGLDALERRLLQEVGTRKPEATRPAIFDLGLADKSTATTPNLPEQSATVQDTAKSHPPSPCTLRLHPRQFRESQISELALGVDNGDKNIPSRQREEFVAKQQAEPRQKNVDSHDNAKGRVTAWLSGLSAASSPGANTAPVIHLAEPKKAPSRKKSIDGVLEFFGIRKNKSTEDLKVVPPVNTQQFDISKEEPSKSDVGLTVPPHSSSAGTVLPQRRTPSPVSPRRKPVPQYVDPIGMPSARPHFNADASPNNSLDTRDHSQPLLEIKQGYGARTKAEDAPLSRLLINPAFGSKRLQSNHLNEAQLPIELARPGKPTSKPSFTPASAPMEFSSAKLPDSKSSVSSPMKKLQVIEKFKDTLPPIPPSARQQLRLPISNIEAKYDVRSARGGRGGITTSVAAIWASRADDNGVSSTSCATPRNIPAQRSPTLPNPGGKEGKAITRRVIPDPSRSESLNSMEPPSPDPIKAISTPAQIHKFHAKPQLSSAATLAQPVFEAKYKPPALSVTLSAVFEPSSDIIDSASSSTKPGEVHFGQARLKDLIKKYQQGAS